MRDLRHGLYIGTKSVLKADVCERHDASVAIDHCLVVRSRNTVAFGLDELHIGTATALSEPDMAHRGEFKLPHDDFPPFAKTQGACDAVDPRRYAGHDSNFIRGATDEIRKSRTCRLILLHPHIPRRAPLMPTCNVVLQTAFHSVGQRTLRAGVEINLALKDFELG